MGIGECSMVGGKSRRWLSQDVSLGYCVSIFSFSQPLFFPAFLPQHFCLAIQGAEMPTKISISLAAKDTNIRVLVVIAITLHPA